MNTFDIVEKYSYNKNIDIMLIINIILAIFILLKKYVYFILIISNKCNKDKEIYLLQFNNLFEID